jgi:hypothetical protein
MAKYEQSTKDEVVAFVSQFNAENGRGGQAAAAKKWDLNPITVTSWLKKAGVKSGPKKSKKVAGVKSATKVKRAYTPRKVTGKKPGPVPRAAIGGPSDALQRMMGIQKEFASLKAEYEKLKGSL